MVNVVFLANLKNSKSYPTKHFVDALLYKIFSSANSYLSSILCSIQKKSEIGKKIVLLYVQQRNVFNKVSSLETFSKGWRKFSILPNFKNWLPTN